MKSKHFSSQINNLIPVKEIQFEDLSSYDIFKQDVPIVITGGCKHWPAFKKWDMDFFSQNYGDVKVPLSNYKEDPYQISNTKPDMALKEYFREVQKILAGQSSSTDHLYSAGWYFTKGYCELLKDIQVPEVFAENWAKKVQDVLYFDTTSLLFGHPRVESPLHTDSFFVSTWFACIKGQKRMRLVEPKFTPAVHNGFDVYSEEKLLELQSKDVPVFDCIIKEGDIVWFPPGWWHYVKNDTFTISLTTNFVSAHHFLPFEQQVRSTLLKPLLGLAKLRQEAILRSAKDLENLDGLECSLLGIRDSRYIQSESKYLNFMQRQAEKTDRLLRVLVEKSSAEVS